MLRQSPSSDSVLLLSFLHSLSLLVNPPPRSSGTVALFGGGIKEYRDENHSLNKLNYIDNTSSKKCVNNFRDMITEKQCCSREHV